LAQYWADENQPKTAKLKKIILSYFCSARADKELSYRPS